jgi:hypothetical protein
MIGTTSARTITRLHTIISVPSTCRGFVLCCCVASSTALADVPLQENHPPVAPSGMDMALGADLYAKRNQFISPGPVSPGGKDACFAIGDQPARAGDKPGWFLPPIMVCMGLSAARVDEMGWAGHEANGDHAKSVGHWAEAEQAYATAVELLERTADKEINQDLAALLNKLGATRFRQNNFTGAETAFRQALTIYTVSRGAEALHVADTLDLVAGSLFQQAQARVLSGPLFYRAWAIREKALGPNHPAVADSLQHVAISLYSDDLPRAIPLLQHSKEIREKVFGRQHPLVANTLNAMARLYEAHDRRDQAIPLYQEALTIQEKVFGPNAKETMQARDDLDMVHQDPQEDPDGLSER